MFWNCILHIYCILMPILDCIFGPGDTVSLHVCEYFGTTACMGVTRCHLALNLKVGKVNKWEKLF